MCVKFFVNNGFGCATATFSVSKNNFCLFITIPNGCRATIGIFRGAYAALTKITSFNAVFYNDPSLTLQDGRVVGSSFSDTLVVLVGKHTLKLSYLYQPGVGLILNSAQTYRFNGQVATCVCVKFFVNSNFGCATATFVLRENTFCLFINLPAGCRVTLHFASSAAHMRHYPGLPASVVYSLIILC